jgi:hypothetical protein
MNEYMMCLSQLKYKNGGVVIKMRCDWELDKAFFHQSPFNQTSLLQHQIVFNSIIFINHWLEYVVDFLVYWS